MPTFKIRNRSARGAAIADMAVALMIMIPVLLFMISLASLACGYISLNFGCQAVAREAGAASSQAQAEQNKDRVRQQILEGPLGNFGGVKSYNLEMVVEQAANGSTNYGAFDGNVDPTGKVYRYRVNATGQIKPLFWPTEVSLRAMATSVIEHPEGLTAPGG